MKVSDLLERGEYYYVDEHDNVLTEAAIRQFKRTGDTLVRKYRCLAGPKAGKLVGQPGKCGTRKNPKNVRRGKKVMRSKKGLITKKGKISKKKAISRMVTKLNKQLAGN